MKLTKIISASICLVLFVGCAQPCETKTPATKASKPAKGDNQKGTTNPNTGEPIDSDDPQGNTPGGSGTTDPDDPTNPVVKDPVTNEPIIKDPVTNEPVIKDPLVVDPNAPSVTELAKSLASGFNSDGYWLRSGYVGGWAVDKRNLKNYLEVRLYGGGDNKTGKLVWSQSANLVGSDDNNGGEHAFSKSVTEDYRTGKATAFYLYAVMDGQEVPFNIKMPIMMTLFKPLGGAGLTAFRATGIQSKCQSCHRGYGENAAAIELDLYQIFWNKIFSEGESGKAWSPTTNHLYEKISGVYKSKHRALGGSSNLCSGYVDCNAIVAWWNIEFKK